MAKYTIELGKIQRSGLKIFSFDYPFYDSELKEQFENKFIKHYFFDEIGQETIGRFKLMLQSRLYDIMPKYTQLYKTEVEARGINFLLNKDLKETFIRDLNTTTNSTGNNTNTVSGKDNTMFKESALNNGNAYLNDDSLTTINKSDNTYDNNTTNKSNVEGSGTQRESTTLISQGNIGTTSSAELLEKWRSSIINIDMMIIEECRNLFMEVF